MPNNKGGKNYKKSKSITDEPICYERLEGQMFGRIIKVLGNCNLLVYCNDGRERICHIRGNMRKKVWMSVGDIVLISIRNFNDKDNIDNISKFDRFDKGDICAKYDQRTISKLRQKDPSINPKLFSVTESNSKNNYIPDEDIFENIIEESESDSEDNLKSKMPANRIAQRIADDEDNIDDI